MTSSTPDISLLGRDHACRASFFNVLYRVKLERQHVKFHLIRLPKQTRFMRIIHLSESKTQIDPGREDEFQKHTATFPENNQAK